MRTDRAVSEVMGFVLVFSLVVSTVAIVSVTGFSTLEDARDTEQLNNAERAFDVLGDNLMDVHQENAPSRATEISLSDANLRIGDEVVVNVTGVRSGSAVTAEFGLTPIVYEGQDGGRIIYSGGAILREEAEAGGMMVDDPPMLLSSERVVVPILQTRHGSNVTDIGGTTVRVRAENQFRRSVMVRHDAQFDKVILNVTTPRNDRWAQALDDYESTTCTTPDDETVHCTVDDPERVYVTVVRIETAFET